MKGREVLKMSKTFTLEELAAFMEERWDTAEYGEFKIGRPTPASLEEYIILPATQNCLVIVYPRNEKVVLSVAQTPDGAKKLALTGIPTNNSIAKCVQAAGSVSLSKELRGPANDIMLIYATYLGSLLKAEGLL